MFYGNWLSSKSPREAFRQAQLSLREKYPEPYWGSFVLVGDLSATMMIFRPPNFLLNDADFLWFSNESIFLSSSSCGQDTWTIHVAVYGRPKGRFGKLYMLFIKPFRVWIVYPSLTNALRKNLESYLSVLCH